MRLEAEFVCSIRFICGGWGGGGVQLSGTDRCLLESLRAQGSFCWLKKLLALAAFHLSFGLRALIERAGSHWDQTWPLSFIPSSLGEVRIYRYSSRWVAKLQRRIYFKRRDYLSYMSERKCPSANVKGGFMVTNIKGQTLRMEIQRASVSVRQRLLVHVTRCAPESTDRAPSWCSWPWH